LIIAAGGSDEFATAELKQMAEQLSMEVVLEIIVPVQMNVFDADDLTNEPHIFRAPVFVFRPLHSVEKGTSSESIEACPPKKLWAAAQARC